MSLLVTYQAIHIVKNTLLLAHSILHQGRLQRPLETWFYQDLFYTQPQHKQYFPRRKYYH